MWCIHVAYAVSREFDENLFTDEDDAGWCAGYAQVSGILSTSTGSATATHRPPFPTMDAKAATGITVAGSRAVDLCVWLTLTCRL